MERTPVLPDGEVEVANQGGSVMLNEPGDRALIFSTDVAPGEPLIWLEDSRSRTLTTVEFQKRSQASAIASTSTSNSRGQEPTVTKVRAGKTPLVKYLP